MAAGALTPIVAMLRDGSHGTQERAVVALEKLTEAGGGGEFAAVGAGVLPLLVTFLRSGHLQGQAAAMHVLHNLAASFSTQQATNPNPNPNLNPNPNPNPNPNLNPNQVVGKEAGAIVACVLMLQRSREAEVVAHAAATLARLSEAGHRVEIVQAGGVEALTLVLRTGGEAGRLAAVHAIASLAQEATSHALGPAKSGLEPLLELAISGGGEAHHHAARTLYLLAVSCERSALTALAASDAAITWFVSRLKGREEEAQLEAVTSLAEISKQPDAPRAIVAAGGVPALVAYGGAGGAGAAPRGEASAQAVACVLAQLAAPPHTEAVGDGGGTPLLVAALRGGDVNATLTLAAVGALRHLVGTAAGSASLMAAGLAPLVSLLQSSTPEAAQVHVLAVLAALAAQPAGRRAVGGAGTAVPLVRLTEGGRAATASAATAILGQLAQESDEVPSLVDAGAVAPLALQLKKGAPAEQKAAVGALLALSDGAGGGAAVKAGVLPALVKLLGADGAPGQLEAMHLLHRLASVTYGCSLLDTRLQASPRPCTCCTGSPGAWTRARR